MIYDYLFSKSYVVIWRSGVDGVSASNLNILRVSSATKKEASEVLYSKSIFLFEVFRYRAVSNQIYKAKTSGLRNAGIKLFHYWSKTGKYQRITAITDRLIQALTSNCQLERFEILTTSNAMSESWIRLASLKTFNLLWKCKEITFHAQTWCMYMIIHDDERHVTCTRQHDVEADWSVLKRKLEEASGHDVQIMMQGEVNSHCVHLTGNHVCKATVRPIRASGLNERNIQSTRKDV